MKILVLIISIVILSVGCEKHWTEQLNDELNKGLAADFEDGCLDGYRMYGYDASYLHGKIKDQITKRLPSYKKISLSDMRRSNPLIYFVALKHEDDCRRKIRREASDRFRLQFGAIEHQMLGESDQGWTSRDRCFTFFMVTESDAVYALSIDMSRNWGSGLWTRGRDFLYGAEDAPVSIWDTSLPDRNSPEQILTQHYKEVFAVYTERPFNYLCYNNVSRLNNFRQLRGNSVFRLCWSTPKCMIFIPEYLLQ